MVLPLKRDQQDPLTENLKGTTVLLCLQGPGKAVTQNKAHACSLLSGTEDLTELQFLVLWPTFSWNNSVFYSY